MDLTKALENLKFDTRMRDWMVKTGMVKPEEIKSNLNSLPDNKEACEPVTLEDRPDFGD